MLKWLSNRRRGEENFGTVYQTVIGEPQASEKFTAAQLKTMDMVGVYAEIEDQADEEKGE